MVNWKNYEEYMLLHADGELNDAEQNALDEFIRLHPELKDELSAYEATRLVPDMAQVYAGKESLLKPVLGTRVISLSSYMRYGTAAAILFLLLFIASKWINRGGDDHVNVPEVAKQEQVAPVTPTADEAPATNPTEPHQQPTPVIAPEHIANTALVSPAPMNQPKEENIEGIAALPLKTLDTNPVATIARQPIAVADISLPVSDEEQIEELRSGFLAWLPVNEEKKEGLNNLKENLDGKIEQAKALKDNIKETNLAVRLGGKEFVVINF